jgi:hypothetical protein
VTVAEARERREAARKLLASGKDPSVERRLEKIAKAAGGNSFREVAEEFLGKQRREGRSEATLSRAFAREIAGCSAISAVNLCSVHKFARPSPVISDTAVAMKTGRIDISLLRLADDATDDARSQ